MAKTKFIEAKDTYLIRHRILRPNQGIDACKYEGDLDVDNFHLGVSFKNEIVSIGSFFKQSNIHFNELAYRLRGMATLSEHRGKGFGSEIINQAEEILKKKDVKILWFNARKSALAFYKRLKFQKIGAEFDIPGIGPHFVMYKSL